MTLRLVLASAIAAAATTAAAQPGGAPPHDAAPSAEMKARHEAMKKQHLDDLRIILRLRPDQEPALAALVASHEPKRLEMKPPAPASTTPERLEAMGRHEAEMRAQHEQMRQALLKFYAALSPDQQKVFDALQRLNGPGPMHMPMQMRDPGGPNVMMMRRGHEGGPPEPPH